MGHNIELTIDKNRCTFCEQCAIKAKCIDTPKFFYNGIGMVLICFKEACPDCFGPMDTGLDFYHCKNCKKFYGYDENDILSEVVHKEWIREANLKILKKESKRKYK